MGLANIFARKWVPNTALFRVILAGNNVVPNGTYFIEDFQRDLGQLAQQGGDTATSGP